MKRAPCVGVMDLGASGGRVFAGLVEGPAVALQEVHRFEHAPLAYRQFDLRSGAERRRLCWNLELLYEQMLTGLAALVSRPDLELVSFGIDTWGSDGAFITAEGDLLGLVGTGRDERWAGERERVLSAIGEERLFMLTGARSFPYNVVNQLAWYVREQPGVVSAAEVYLPVGGILAYYLCGRAAAEHTWMSTTQLCRAGSPEYCDEVLSALGIARAKLPSIVMPGTVLGPARGIEAETAGCSGVRVVMPALHDTACAFEAAGTRPGDRRMVVSSGTWSLAGVLVEDPILTSAAHDAGFANEAGVSGTRFQRNLAGTWPAQQLREAFAREDGRRMSWQEFGELSLAAAPLATLIDVDDPCFYAPADMRAAIASYCERTSQPPPAGRAGMCRAVYEGLAIATARAARGVRAVTGTELEEIVVVGGGARNDLLNQWIASASGLPVRTGSPDATALGNAVVQARAVGLLPVAGASDAHRPETAAPQAGHGPERVYVPESGAWGEAVARLSGTGGLS